MTFNAGAIPFAIISMIFGIGMWTFRMRLTELSDRTYGRRRSPDERKTYARIAVVPLLFSICLAAVALFAPLWP